MDLKDATIEDIFAELQTRAGVVGAPVEINAGDALPAITRADAIKDGTIKGYERPGFVCLGFSPASKKDDAEPDMSSYAAGPISLVRGRAAHNQSEE